MLNKASIIGHNQAHAAFLEESKIAFMRETGFKWAKAMPRTFMPRGIGNRRFHWPNGFDHTQVWVQPTGCPGLRRYAITTEPYSERLGLVEVGCSTLGWEFHSFPEGIGLWFPMGGTRLVLISPGERGVYLEPFVERLNVALPKWSAGGKNEEA